MTINEKIEDALNEQINKELYSGYMYLSMATYFESINLKGFAHWMREQDKEEREHAMKIFDYVIERGGRVSLTSIDAPPTEWKSPLDAFEEVYKHEQKVTGLINTLVDLAKSENDYATDAFLQWFVEEQVEEEASADEIVQKLKLIGDSGAALLMIDRELAQRGK